MSINTDALAQEIIAAKLSVKPVQADETNPGLLESINQMNAAAVNHSYRDIPSGTLKEKLIRPFKRLMRRLTFWFVEPCVLQQNEYNAANNRFSLEVNSEINALHSEIQSADAHSSEIQDMYVKFAVRLDEMQKQLRKAEAQNDALKKQYEQKLEEIRQSFRKEQEAFSEALREQKQQTDMLKPLEEKVNLLEKLSYLSGEHALTQSEADEFRVSFSQCGEDAVIRYIFSVLNIQPETCRYVDLGANHAVHLSNTYGFYRDGARGVLVDANPVLTQELSERRPGDIVINKCLAPVSGSPVKFYILSGDGLSTMDEQAAQNAIRKNPSLSIEKIIMTDTVTISEIFSEYFPDKAPEILNIDLEGLEMTILHMIDFKKYRPLVIVCEMISYRNTLTIGEKNQEILDFMHSVGYEEFAFTGINSIFIDKTAKELKTS